MVRLVWMKLVLVTLICGIYLSSRVTFKEALSYAESPLVPLQAVPEQDIHPEDGDELKDLLEVPLLDTAKATKDEIGKYLELIDNKLQRLEVRREMLKTDLARMAEFTTNISERSANLKAQQEFFDQTIQKEQKMSEEALDQLVELYKKMDAKKAASIFSAMREELAAQVFKHKKMPQKQVTEILGEMDPQKAVSLTQYLSRIKSGAEYKMMEQIHQALSKEFAPCDGSKPSGS